MRKGEVLFAVNLSYRDEGEKYKKFYVHCGNKWEIGWF